MKGKEGSGQDENVIRDKVKEFVNSANIVLDELKNNQQIGETMQSFKERIGDFMDVYIPPVTKDIQEIKDRFKQLQDSIKEGKSNLRRPTQPHLRQP